MSEKYDVIIIGAGIGGLTAAAILARNGKKVLVSEKNPVPGGYAVNFCRGEFEFDVSLHLINNLDRKGGISYSILEECGIKDKLQMLSPKYLYRSIFPDFDIRVPQCNPKSYIKILISRFPKEKEGIEKLCEVMSSIFYKVEGLQGTKISTADFVSYLYTTSQDMLDKFIEDEKLKALILQLWPYYGSPPTKLSAFYFCYPWHDYTYIGGFYPAGGGKTISSALVEVIKKNNGAIKLNSKVERILIKDNISYGIENSQGDVIQGKRIISNIDALSTFHNLVGNKHVSADFIKKIDGMQPSLSAFVVYLGLNEHFKKVNKEDYIIFINSSYKTDTQFISFIENDANNVPLSLTLYSNLPSNMATGGNKYVMTIMTLAGYDFWKNMSLEEYKKHKNKFASILIKRAEEFIPNLSAYIERIETASPLTMERYTGSYKGAIYGWSQLVSQSGSNRLKQNTPIDHLYLSGAWTQPGSGIKGVMRSGMNTAHRILKETK
ncbi:MAG: NAD(P)/FAD-dependent oxidoreductase [Nitrospirae bacterium]|nr:NAD(P)/FAD-dependent oxidoreductase [Nitrospirota bacterium]